MKIKRRIPRSSAFQTWVLLAILALSLIIVNSKYMLMLIKSVIRFILGIRKIIKDIIRSNQAFLIMKGERVVAQPK